MWRQRAASSIHSEYLYLKVDAATILFPISITGRIRAVATANFFRRLDTIAMGLRVTINFIRNVRYGVFARFIVVVGHSGSMPDCVSLC